MFELVKASLDSYSAINRIDYGISPSAHLEVRLKGRVHTGVESAFLYFGLQVREVGDLHW